MQEQLINDIEWQLRRGIADGKTTGEIAIAISNMLGAKYSISTLK